LAGVEAVEVPLKTRTSDLRVRVVSAIVMLVVAGGALWLGGWAWRIFVILVGAGVLWEWQRLVLRFASAALPRTVWAIAGLLYTGVTVAALIVLRDIGWPIIVVLIALVVATDVGAYFSGRTFGGPKIAPRISPSKTWAGLIGGMILAVISGMAALHLLADFSMEEPTFLDGVSFAVLAVVSQAGDFFESWMKRKAGVKDSSNLIPGHGGLFDRFDGLLAVVFALGLAVAIGSLFPAASTPVEVGSVKYP